MATRIKICGITRAQDALAVCDAGADAIGLVFYDKSPRAVSLQQAQQICAVLPPFITVVALFVDPDVDLVERVIDAISPDMLQFHGDETEHFCGSFKRPYLKAIAAKSKQFLIQQHGLYQASRAVLVDTFVSGVPGGTGETFDWQMLANIDKQNLVLAGGLNADNVSAAIQQVQPAAVDVSGGVEVSKGIKSAEKIHAFVNAVRAVDKQL